MYDTYVTTISMATYQEWAMSTTIGSKNVNSRTRAGNNGKFIICPECHQGETVYHFAWSALGCVHCGDMIEKNEWRLL
jgi:ribosomal protein S27E|tara:strand:+ start:1249 stop:1482 length:234 start_codon:yes stop_codon:yes gene_type:complete